MKTLRSDSGLKNIFLSLVLFMLVFSPAASQTSKIPSPKEHFGFNIGDDYNLSTYTQTEAYFKKLALSDRTKLVDIGLTEEGRHQYMLIVSSPTNIKNLAKYQDISRKLARAEGISEEQAQSMANEGKSVVWIDGGLHATEVVGSHQLIETAWQLVSRTDKETMDILDNTIILLVHANPDGQELVSSWYMKDKEPKDRNMNIPRLYQKYAGHDNNRDFYMLAMKESKNISRQLYLEWMPQILYNHHQAGPAGTVVAGPPYRDPFNYVFDPLLVTGIDAVGAAMNNRLYAENKPGYTQRSGSSYSTWYNGGLRTTAYFHNMIGLLTEIIGSPTPGEVPFVPDRLIPNGATPFPVRPQPWHFRQSIDYSISLNYAVLDYASRYRSELLYNIYRMGKNSIERGSSDYWTLSPKVIEAMKTAYANDRKGTTESPARTNESGFGGASRIPVKYYDLILKDPVRRDPRGYIVQSDQEDFPTAVKFINALIGSGIQVYKASADFTVNGKKYPAGSFILKTAQSFRPHVIDLFEPQDHPNDFQYPGGPPIRPYDAAGWTLAFQMGVSFDRILDSFDGPFTLIPYGEEQSPALKNNVPQSKGGFVISPKVNNSFIVVNDLLKNGIQVFRLPEGIKNSSDIAPGAFYIPSSSKSETFLAKYANENGVKITGISERPGITEKVMAARIAVWNRYGGSMPAGWLSWILEQFHFKYDMIYSQSIDSGNLKKKYDVIILTSGAIPQVRRGSDNQASFTRQQPVNEAIPADYRSMTGNLSADKSVPQLVKFMEEGGTIITMESSTNLAFHLKLSVKNALVKTNASGQEVPLAGTEYYIPGSILTADAETKGKASFGIPSKVDVYFDQSPVFKLEPEAAARGIKPLLWFSNETPMRSGWAFGQSYLKDGVIAFSAPVGSGEFYAFGPNITFRSQTHGAFRLIFNQLYRAGKK
jgi:hypothetical protein